MEIIAPLALVNCIVSPILLAALVAIGVLFFRYYRQSSGTVERLSDKIRIITKTSENATREIWFESLQSVVYRSELEVETKFIYPMMRYLGYAPNELSMRVPAVVRVGRQNVNGEADWLVFREGKPAIVIEAKNQNQPLDIEVQQQARSYCFAFSVSKYVLTNGREIQIYQRGVESDLLIFECKTEELPSKWSDLHRLIGVQP